jgi:hypothetical protein
MDFVTAITGIIISAIAILGIPSVVLFFIYKLVKDMKEKDKIKQKKKILELEVEKQRNQIRLLEEENKKYDNIINNS